MGQEHRRWYLREHVLELDDFGAELLLAQQLVALHLLDLAQVRVLGVVPLLARLVKLRLQRHRLVVENRELRLQALVLGRLHHHRLGQLPDLLRVRPK